MMHLTKVNVHLEPKRPAMKAKHLSLAIAVLLAAGGLWFAGSAWRTHALYKSANSHQPESQISAGENASGRNDVLEGRSKSAGGNNDRSLVTRANPDSGSKTLERRPKSDQMLRPPVPNQHFTDFTPEQRGQFARQGHGPGG